MGSSADQTQPRKESGSLKKDQWTLPQTKWKNKGVGKKKEYNSPELWGKFKGHVMLVVKIWEREENDNKT